MTVRSLVFRDRLVAIDRSLFALISRSMRSLALAERTAGARRRYFGDAEMPIELSFVEPMDRKPAESLPSDEDSRHETEFDGS